MAIWSDYTENRIGQFCLLENVLPLYQTAEYGHQCSERSSMDSVHYNLRICIIVGLKVINASSLRIFKYIVLQFYNVC